MEHIFLNNLNNSFFRGLITVRENSSNIYGGFNLGTHVGDNKKRVLLRREDLKKLFGDNKKLIIPNQIHSNIVKIVEDDSLNYECDALITNKPDVILGVLVADCVPILIYDDEKKVFSVIHAGWRGTITEICKNVIEILKEKFLCDVKNLQIVIGPAISGDCYEVGSDVYENFQTLFDVDMFKKVCTIKNNKGYLDLQMVNKLLLEREGILEKNIEVIDICTHCNTDRFYSYRKDGVTGRFGIFGCLY